MNASVLGRWAGSEINEAKVILANEVTALCHGEEAAAAAEATAREVFEKGGVGADLPTLSLAAYEIGDGISVVQLIVKSGLAKSGKEAKRLIAENGAKLDDQPLTETGVCSRLLIFPRRSNSARERSAMRWCSWPSNFARTHYVERPVWALFFVATSGYVGQCRHALSK